MLPDWNMDMEQTLPPLKSFEVNVVYVTILIIALPLLLLLSFCLLCPPMCCLTTAVAFIYQVSSSKVLTFNI